MKKILSVLFLLLTAALTKAQQLPQYSQYLLNDFAINPAIAGTRPYFDGRTNIRNQWMGITDAPRTYVLTVNGPIKNQNMGLGGMLFTDITGPTRRVGFNMSYAYHLKITEKTKLSFGLSAGLLQFSIDGSKIILRDQNDQYIGNMVQSVVVPDFGFGLYFYHENYFVSVSAPQLTQNKLNFFENVSSQAKLEDHYYAAAGYKFKLGESFKFEPSAIMKFVRPVPVQFDVSGRFIYKDKFWLGGTYRTMDAVAGLIGFNIQEDLFFGYSYDYALSNLQNYSHGTHEVMMGIKFGKQPKTAVPSIE